MLSKTKIGKVKILLAVLSAGFVVYSIPAINALHNPKYIETNDKQAKLSNASEVVGSIIITDNPGDIVNSLKAEGLKPKQVIPKGKSKTSFVTLPEKPEHPRLRALAQQKGFTVAPDYVYRSMFMPDDSNYDDQWNMSKVAAPKAWDITTGSTDVTIAVLDTGILFDQTINGTTYTQPDFPTSRKWINTGESGLTEIGEVCWSGLPADKQFNDCDDDENGYIDDVNGWDFMGGYRGNDAGCPNFADSTEYESSTDNTFVMQDNDPQPYSCDSFTSPSVLNKDHYNGNCIAFESACFVGHGTMVASVAAAETNNTQLIAGINHKAKIMNIRSLDGYGYTTTARIASGVHYAADNGADVLNMSIGTNCEDNNFTDTVMETALKAAADADVVMVAASGNEYQTNSICYPASSQYVMSVGATDINDKRIGYSNYSDKLDVVAPAGVPVANAPSARINSNYYATAGGTSLSTPHVAGLASLMRGVDPSLSRTDIMKIIRERTDRIAGMQGRSFHPEYGTGRINMYISISVADGIFPVYRLYNGRVHNHLLTASVKERDSADDNLGFRYEGIVFWTVPKGTPGAMPVYRLYNGKVNNHLLTASAQERDASVKKLGFRYEGIVFWTVPKGTPGAMPVYRLYNGRVHNHLLTASVKERDSADDNLGFRYEGIVFWMPSN